MLDVGGGGGAVKGWTCMKYVGISCNCSKL